MTVKLETIVRDFLAFRGESPDLLPMLEEGEDSAVLTLSRQLEVRLPSEAFAAELMTPSELQGDVARDMPAQGYPADFLKFYSPSVGGAPARYIPLPAFDGQTLTISRAAYSRLLKTE